MRADLIFTDKCPVFSTSLCTQPLLSDGLHTGLITVRMTAAFAALVQESLEILLCTSLCPYKRQVLTPHTPAKPDQLPRPLAQVASGGAGLRHSKCLVKWCGRHPVCGLQSRKEDGMVSYSRPCARISGHSAERTNVVLKDCQEEGFHSSTRSQP